MTPCIYNTRGICACKECESYRYECVTNSPLCKHYAGYGPIEIKTESHDPIEHPSHYTEGRKYEPKDVIRDWGLNFNLGSAVKYISRAGRKDDIIQDLKKAQQFIQFEIDALEEERKSQ